LAGVADGLVGVEDGFGSGGGLGVADGLVITVALAVITGAGVDSDDADSDEAGVISKVTISAGCMDLQGAVLKLKIGLAETRSVTKR